MGQCDKWYQWDNEGQWDKWYHRERRWDSESNGHWNKEVVSLRQGGGTVGQGGGTVGKEVGA